MDVLLDDLIPTLTRFFTEILDCSGNPYFGKTFHTLMMAVNRTCVSIHGVDYTGALSCKALRAQEYYCVIIL